MTTESQLRLERNLTNLFGGGTPHKRWTLDQIIDVLLDYKSKNTTFVKLDGTFIDRYAPDRLSGAGFGVQVNTNDPSFTISW